MDAKLALTILLLLPFFGCGTTSRLVHLDVGQNRPRIYAPRHEQESVELRQDE